MCQAYLLWSNPLELRVKDEPGSLRRNTSGSWNSQGIPHKTHFVVSQKTLHERRQTICKVLWLERFDAEGSRSELVNCLVLLLSTNFFDDKTWIHRLRTLAIANQGRKPIYNGVAGSCFEIMFHIDQRFWNMAKVLPFWDGFTLRQLCVMDHGSRIYRWCYIAALYLLRIFFFLVLRSQVTLHVYRNGGQNQWKGKLLINQTARHGQSPACVESRLEYN